LKTQTLQASVMILSFVAVFWNLSFEN